MAKKFEGKSHLVGPCNMFSPLDHVYFSTDDPFQRGAAIKVSAISNLKNFIEQGGILQEDKVYLLATPSGSEGVYVLGEGPYRAGLIADYLNQICNMSKSISPDYVSNPGIYAKNLENKLKSSGIKDLESEGQKLLTQI